MTVEDEKYVVLKRADWEKFEINSGPAISRAGLEPLKDAVVIRTQDVFATQGLYAYAYLVQFALEVTALSTERRVDLETARDYFFERAREAEEKLRGGRGAKFPD